MKTLIASGQSMGSTWIVLFLCVCVLTEMVGMPMTLISLLTTSDMLAESGSEDDPPMLPQVPELRPSSALLLRMDGQTTPHLPVLAASVFHPPLT